MSKFIKKDSSHFQKSKIAKETAEAIKYLNKRQPLAVQNSKKVNDEELFSIPSKKKKVQAKETSPPRLVESPSQSPPKTSMQLYHTSNRAKFFRNAVESSQHPAETEPDGQETAHEKKLLNRRYQNRRGNKTVSQGNFNV